MTYHQIEHILKTKHIRPSNYIYLNNKEYKTMIKLCGSIFKCPYTLYEYQGNYYFIDKLIKLGYNSKLPKWF